MDEPQAIDQGIPADAVGDAAAVIRACDRATALANDNGEQRRVVHTTRIAAADADLSWPTSRGHRTSTLAEHRRNSTLRR